MEHPRPCSSARSGSPGCGAPSYLPYSTPLWNRFGAVFGCVCRLRREIFISELAERVEYGNYVLRCCPWTLVNRLVFVFFFISEQSLFCLTAALNIFWSLADGYSIDIYIYIYIYILIASALVDTVSSGGPGGIPLWRDIPYTRGSLLKGNILYKGKYPL